MYVDFDQYCDVDFFVNTGNTLIQVLIIGEVA